MLSKTRIYIEKVSLEIIAQNSTRTGMHFRNVIEIFRKHADLCLNVTEQDLDAIQNPQNLDEPGDIFSFIQGYDLPWPSSASNKFEAIRNNSNDKDINGNVIYILNNVTEVNNLKELYGVWAILDEDVDDSILCYSFNKAFDKPTVPNGWNGVFSNIAIKLPPSNSFVISDSNLLKNTILDRQNEKYFCGLENVKDILSILLPRTLSACVPFYIIVICEPKELQPGKTKKIITKWIKEVCSLRKYEIIIEFFTSKYTLHSRNLYANNYSIALDRGFYVLRPWTNQVNINDDSFNKMNVSTYLCSPFDDGDSILTISLTELERVRKRYLKFLNNVGDPIMIEPIDPNHYSKNRILF